MKCIAIDLDGTLLNKESVISAENREAIKRAVDAGILVTICTGRATFDVKALLDDLDILSLQLMAVRSTTRVTV